MVNKNYYVGVLLAASRNPLNKIQFFAVEKKEGGYCLYSRTKNFALPLNPKFMTKIGEYDSLKAIASAINKAKFQMKTRGISVPGVELLVTEKQ